MDHAAAQVEDWPDRSVNQLCGSSNIRPRQCWAGIRSPWCGPLPEFHHLVLHILGYVDQHGARPSRGRNTKRLRNDSEEFCGRAHQEVVLSNGDTDAVGVDLLKGISTDQSTWHLAGDADEWNRVQLGIGNCRQEVGSARARGGETHGRFAADARHSLSNEASALFVARQHMTDLPA